MIKRNKRREFRTGDLVKLDNPNLITLSNRQTYENKVTGKRLRVKVCAVEGVHTRLPFAKILIQKRFVFYRSIKQSRSYFMLYDNYKPEILGKGWIMEAGRSSIFRRVGRVIDIRKLPTNLISLIKADLVDSKFLPRRALSKNESMGIIRASRLHIFEKDPGIRYAIHNIVGEQCLNCGESLAYTKLEVLLPNRLHIGRIKHKASKILGYTQEGIAGVFPALFICGECKRSTALIFLNNYSSGLAEFVNVNVGDPESFVRK